VTFQAIRRVVFGERLPTDRAIHERLPKFLALPIFSSDAISSSAYAVEEIILVLMACGAAALSHSIAVAGAISILFAIVAISYRQTITAYPSGGGAYVVARENLGLLPGVIAAAALLTDYVLTVAVSVASGVDAVVSAIPALAPHNVHLGLVFICIIVLANLRGAREAGWIFAGPTYLFVLMGIILIVTAGVRLALGYQPPPTPHIPIVQSLTLILLLRAFSSGCAALTGIEAISNAVQAFKPPEARNASVTLLIMTGICIFLFLGYTLSAQLFHIVASQAGAVGYETVFSKLGHAVFGVGPLYYLLQISTAIILVLAANTSFAGFPRLASIMAQDRLAPRQLANLGDRLVFSNGILVLGLISALLLVIFKGVTTHLIPLYAVGVFMAFTLSQSGMFVRRLKLRTPGWKLKATINAIGACATAIALIVVATTKFMGGAWIVMLLIPILVLAFLKVSQHYEGLRSALTIKGYHPPRALRHAVIVLIPSLHRGTIHAILYAKSLARDAEAVHVEIDPADTPRIQQEWEQLHLGLPLTILKSPWRSLTEPIILYIRTLRAERGVDMVTVVLPEFTTTRWWHKLLHNQSGLMLKFALMFEPGVIVTNVRYRISESDY
jgi:amino acid transporter